MSGELKGIVAEFRDAMTEGIRQCLAVGEDIQVVVSVLEATQPVPLPRRRKEAIANIKRESSRSCWN
jgi:hypothetical protein